MPAAEYTRRYQNRRSVWVRLDKRFHRVANLRLMLFFSALVLLWPVFGPWRVPLPWLLLPIAAFIGAAFWHDRVRLARLAAERAMHFYEGGLNRMKENWAGHGDTGERFLDPDHPYAADLDLFGKGSLFERISAARTQMGEETLAGWMTAPAPCEVVRDRQAAIQELTARLELRENLAVLGEDIRSKVDQKGLAEWGASPATTQSRGLLLGMHGLVLGTFFALAAWPLFEIGALPFLGMILLECIFVWRVAPRVNAVLAQVEKRNRDLALLSAVLHRLEGEECRTPLLLRLRADLGFADQSASRRIAELSRLVDRLDWRRNQMFAPVAALLLWGTRHALAIDAWRVHHGASLHAWLQVAGQLEALSSLAGYAYEEPGNIYPEILDQGPTLEGAEMGHPLLPTSTCVRNDFRIGGNIRLIVMSGSNMSGKSTMLRTVGLNAVLALAGAPVRAKALRLSVLQIGTTLRIQDSLQAGQSRFYAEILRLRRIMELAAHGRLLFLLDELLAGTNSHDRRHGAEGILRGLLGHGAIGVITTHDLALAEIADILGNEAVNVHFADRMDGGSLEFDYRIRPGIVKNSNALELMRAVGLQV